MNDFTDLVILVLAFATFYVVGLGALVWAVFSITDAIFSKKDVPAHPYWYLQEGRRKLMGVYEVFRKVFSGPSRYEQAVRDEQHKEQEAADAIIARMEAEAARDNYWSTCDPTHRPDGY